MFTYVGIGQRKKFSEKTTTMVRFYSISGIESEMGAGERTPAKREYGSHQTNTHHSNTDVKPPKTITFSSNYFRENLFMIQIQSERSTIRNEKRTITSL